MRAVVGLTIAAVCVALLQDVPVPVLDEELWLYIGQQLDPLRPYDWLRAMPPWGVASVGDAYVFAHPPVFPLWVWAASHVTQDVVALRWWVGLPVAAMFGAAMGALCERFSKAPLLVGALWLSLPVVAMGLQRGLMPDALCAALMTVGLVGWLAGPQRRVIWLAGGLAVGLAVETKYPAVLFLTALIAHGLRGGGLRERLPFFLIAALPIFAIEGWLWTVYGRPHLWEVLSRAGEIERGPLAGRALGLLVRLPFAAPVVLLIAHRWSWPSGFLLGGAALVLAWPSELYGLSSFGLLLLACAGGNALAYMLRCSFVGRMRGSNIDEVNRRGLGFFALLVVAGVLVGHNYASPRYLLAAAAPVVLLIAGGSGPKRAWWALVFGQAMLSAWMGRAEARYARAADAVAAAAAAAFPGGGRFNGEWTFRWRLEREGWTWAEAPEPGGVFVTPTQAPHVAPPAEVHELARYQVEGAGLRLLDLDAGVGYYAETLGPLPLGWGSGPLEEAVMSAYDR